MYKVLLVDDEPLITEGLQALVDWEDYGFEVVQRLENGQEALAYLERNEIDLLVTDIVMPKKTGLELIAEVQKINPTIKTIILSGYEEFDYIKKGIALGIENYLIKPVDEDELVQTIKGIGDTLSDNREQLLEAEDVLKENTIWRLLRNEIKTEEWQERMTFYRFEKDQATYVAAIIDFLNIPNEAAFIKVKRAIDDRFGTHSVAGSNGELVFISSGEHEQALSETLQQIASFLKEQVAEIGTFYIATGHVVNRLDQISDSYFKARENSLYQIIVEPNSVISNKTHVDRYSLLKSQQHYKTEMVKAIHESKGAVAILIDDFYKHLSQNNQYLVPAVSRKYTIDLVTYIHHSIQDVKHYNHTIAIEKLVQARSNEQIKKILTEYCDELIDAISQMDEKRSPIIKDVLEYIHASYAKELSLKTLSQRFHVNSIYLGQLFQKEMGIVFSEYINHLRIEKAKELLKTTHLTAGEIGRQVGYSDTTYFYKQFKKYVSVTPTEWRKV